MNGKKARALRKADTREFVGYEKVNTRMKECQVGKHSFPYQTFTLVKVYK